MMQGKRRVNQIKLSQSDDQPFVFHKTLDELHATLQAPSGQIGPGQRDHVRGWLDSDDLNARVTFCDLRGLTAGARPDLQDPAGRVLVGRDPEKVPEIESSEYFLHPEIAGCRLLAGDDFHVPLRDPLLHAFSSTKPRPKLPGLNPAYC